MRCPQCHTDEDKVLETRILAQGVVIRRRRMCIDCNFRFTSYERIEEQHLYVIKKNDSREQFSREKLRNGIVTAVRKRPVSSEKIEDLLDEIEEKAQVSSGTEREISSFVLGDMIIKALLKIDPIAYLRFSSVYRNFETIDEFIDEITSCFRRNDNDFYGNDKGKKSKSKNTKKK